jgi:glutathione S-transferase
MKIDELAHGKYILWGANWSLYSAKVRPYLRKKNIDYVEVNPSHPHFSEKILATMGNLSVPVLEMPSGEFIADSTEIIEHLEGQYPDTPMIPTDKTMAALAWLIHNYGSEGLHKPAMHFRWNTTEENRQFITDEFERSFEVRSKREVSQKTLGSEFAQNMKAYLPVLGITTETVDVIELSTRKLYGCLNAHFLNFPYVLGGRPSIADFGLMAPIYAHLGRDVSSSNQLKLEAPALYRWIETMNQSNITDAELWSVPASYFEKDQLPDSLIGLLKLLCADYGPELIATADLYDQWLKEVPDRPTGSLIAADGQKATHQAIGEIEHFQQGVKIRRMALLDCLTLHQRMTVILDSMEESERHEFECLLESVGGNAFTSVKLERKMVRKNYAYVIA